MNGLIRWWFQYVEKKLFSSPLSLKKRLIVIEALESSTPGRPRPVRMTTRKPRWVIFSAATIGDLAELMVIGHMRFTVKMIDDDQPSNFGIQRFSDKTISCLEFSDILSFLFVLGR